MALLTLVHMYIFLLSSISCQNSTDKHCTATRKIQQGNKYVNQQIQVCCSPYVQRSDNLCYECPSGSIRLNDTICKPCENGEYGIDCGEKCNCSGAERCDPVTGCTKESRRPYLRGTTTESEFNNARPSPNPDQDRHNDVIIYMSCIAVIGIAIALIFGGYRNKAWVQEKIRSWANRRESFPRLENGATFRPEGECKESAERKSENVYDDINEKYMLKNI